MDKQGLFEEVASTRRLHRWEVTSQGKRHCSKLGPAHLPGFSKAQQMGQ